MADALSSLTPGGGHYHYDPVVADFGCRNMTVRSLSATGRSFSDVVHIADADVAGMRLELAKIGPCRVGMPGCGPNPQPESEGREKGNR